MNKEVWVIYEEHGLNPNYKTFRIYDDETIALESYMSFKNFSREYLMKHNR